MAIDPPYRLDPFRNIVNIQWGGRFIIHTAVFKSSEGMIGQNGFALPNTFLQHFDIETNVFDDYAAKSAELNALIASYTALGWDYFGVDGHFDVQERFASLSQAKAYAEDPLSDPNANELGTFYFYTWFPYHVSPGALYVANYVTMDEPSTI